METAHTRNGVDRFELIRPLGEGGSGTVFEARERATGARVALKILHEQTGLELLHFKQEFRALGELSHPNVVRFGGLFEEAGRFYFTMELVEGDGFLDYVRPGRTRAQNDASSISGHGRTDASEPTQAISGRVMRARRQVHDGTLDVDRLRNAMSQLASGLIALHAAGFIHRDVKPQNVLVTSTGRVVLLDFGLAMSIDDSQRRELAGTLAYMAPEQAMWREVTGAADWYALGAVLYEALTGRLPHSHLPARNFWEESRLEMPSPSSYVDGLPGDLCALCVDLLRFDAQRRPDESAIARRLGIEVENERARASFRSQVHFVRGIFVARARELDALRAAVSRVRQGAFTIVRIHGESGIGKSALMRQFTSELSRLDSETVVLSSRCYERETVPYRGADGVIDALVQHLETTSCAGEVIAVPQYVELLAQVFPVLRALPGFEGEARPELLDLDPHEARLKAFHALRELFRWLTERRPVVIHLDDAQWIDAESVTLLSFLLNERSSRTLFVVATRPSFDEPLAELLQGASDVTRLLLEPLSVADSEELVSLLLDGSSKDTDLEPVAVARKSGGHPLFIHELVVHANKGDPSVGSLEGAISSRLEGLDASCRSLLDLVAIADAPLEHSVVQAASGLSPQAFPWVLSTLRGENLVSFHASSLGNYVHAYHDRIRELVVSRMPAQARRGAHRRLALALEQRSPSDLDALAHHFAGADEPEPATRYARAAGERSLQKLAFEHAARVFRLALQFERGPQARGELEARLGDALASSGRGSEAAEAYLRAAPLSGAAAALELRRRAGEQLLRAGHVEQGTRILFAMLRELGLWLPQTDVTALLSLVWTLIKLKLRGLGLRARQRPISPRDRLRLDACWTVATGLSLDHHLRATEFQARALLFALNAGDADRVVKCAALLGATLGNAGGIVLKIGSRFKAHARELVAISPSDENTAWLDLMHGVAHMGDWDFASCERLCAQAEITFVTRCTGAAWEIATAQAFLLWSSTFRGNLRAASARLPELLESARSRGDRHAETTLILSPVHLVGLAADEPARVRQQCETIMSKWPSTLAPFQHMCGAYVLAQVDLYDSKVESAWEHVSYAWRMLRRGHLSRVQFQRVDLLGLRARAALGRAAAVGGAARAAWLRRVDADVRRLRREAIPAARALADMVAGGALHLEGRGAESLVCLTRASTEFEELGMRLHARVTELAYSVISRDAEARRNAERCISDLGVASAAGMLRLWLPGIVPEEPG